MTTTHGEPDRELDALVVGAGVSGLLALHLLREQGLRVHAVDAADDVGGVWWWNGYPGARLSSEAHLYQYLVPGAPERLVADWGWSERFPAGYEVLRWVRFVADRLDLRRDLTLGTRVLAARWDADRARWRVRTDRAGTVAARFLVACTGTLSVPREDAVPGRAAFAGPVLHTGRWPAELRWPARGPDFAGLRVGMIGTGASGVQAVPALADRVGHLTVFSRTPSDLLPMTNPMYGWRERDADRARVATLAATLPDSPTGTDRPPGPAWSATSPADRHARMAATHDDGSTALWDAGFADLLTDPRAAAGVAAFVRDRMRERLVDPALVDALVPDGRSAGGFGARPVALESGFCAAVRRDDVTVVDVRARPITRLVADGVERADGTVHPLDVVVLATGFEAATGALSRMDVRGRGGRSLATAWARDVRTTYGLAVHGFPNLLTVGAPLAPSAGSGHVLTCLQQQVTWVADAIRDLLAGGGSTIEPTAAGQDAWVAHHDAVAAATVVAGTPSWWTGGTGRPPGRVLPHPGGVGAYRRACVREAEAGYPSFVRT